MLKKSFVTTLLILTLATACAPATKIPLPASTASGVPSPELTATSSPTSVPTAAPTETLAPAPRIFTEDFNGAAPNWTIQQVDNGNPLTGPGIDAGFLTFTLNAPNQWVYDIYNVDDYQNVRIDVQTEIRTGDGAEGVVCRYSETNGWYEFNIYADQTYMLLFGQWISPGVAKYSPLFHGNSEKIKSDANEIGLLCAGKILTPFINGVQMRKWEENKFSLTNGGVGISISSFENIPTQIAIDWVKVSEP